MCISLSFEKWIPGKDKAHILKWCKKMRKDLDITPKLLMSKFDVDQAMSEEIAKEVGWSLQKEICAS